MQVFLETERMVLRRFTVADVDHLVDLDSDPEVMRFLTGGRPTPREVVQHDILPAFLRTLPSRSSTTSSCCIRNTLPGNTSSQCCISSR